MINFLKNLFRTEYDDKDIVTYVRTEWGNETKHLSNADCIGYYNDYLIARGRIK